MIQQEQKRRMPTQAEANQRHGHVYITRLMNTEDLQTIEADFGQIALAFRRIKAEEIGSSFHPGLIETRYLALAGSFVPKYLDKLVQGNATGDDATSIRSAIESVELGEVEYPVTVTTLKKLFVGL